MTESPGSGPEREVVELFDRHRVPLLRFLISSRVPPAEAEEIVQEAFLLLFHHLRRGGGKANLQGWLFGTAHRLALRRYARTARRREVPADEANTSEPRDGRWPGPDERYEMVERRERLLAAVDALREQDQLCLSLRAEGLSYREIAGALGVSLGSVANSMQRALTRLTRVAGF